MYESVFNLSGDAGRILGSGLILEETGRIQKLDKFSLLQGSLNILSVSSNILSDSFWRCTDKLEAVGSIKQHFLSLSYIRLRYKIFSVLNLINLFSNFMDFLCKVYKLFLSFHALVLMVISILSIYPLFVMPAGRLREGNLAAG